MLFGHIAAGLLNHLGQYLVVLDAHHQGQHIAKRLVEGAAVGTPVHQSKSGRMASRMAWPVS